MPHWRATPSSGAHGAIAASSDPGLRLAGPSQHPTESEPLAFERIHDDGPVVAKELMRVTGRPVRNAAGELRAMAYVLPREPEADAPATDLRADARRTLWISVALASVVAAALALLLARPLVGQVSRLAAAAERVRAGDLGARVEVRSRDELGRMGGRVAVTSVESQGSTFEVWLPRAR